MNWRNAVIAALVVFPLLILLAVGFGRDPHAVPSVLTGRPAPNFSLKSLDGKTLGLAELRGKPVVINFWSTWCQPCKLEHNLLQEAAAHYSGRVQFLGIVYQDTAENARSYLAERGSAYPQMEDPKSLTAIDFGVAGVPESFFVDSQGVIRHKEPGVLSAEVIGKVLGELVTEGAFK